MGRTVLPSIITILLISAVVIIQGVNVAIATPPPPLPPTPDLSEPSITIQMPEQNKTYNVNSVPYSITVEKPSSWFDVYPVHGTIMDIDYILDENQHVEIANDPAYYEQGPFTYKGTMSGLSEGNHSIEVYVRSDSFYDPSNSTTQPPFPKPLDHYLDTYSGKVYFSVDTTSPSVSFLISAQNATYPLGEVPLGFVVSEPTSAISYCLDNTSNVTTVGNITLTGLSAGAHNVTVYAWDTAGNFGASETVTFTVDKQPESTSEPEPFPWLIVTAVSVAVVAVVAAGILVCFKKRKRGQPT